MTRTFLFRWPCQWPIVLRLTIDVAREEMKEANLRANGRLPSPRTDNAPEGTV